MPGAQHGTLFASGLIERCGLTQSHLSLLQHIFTVFLQGEGDTLELTEPYLNNAVSIRT